MHLIYYILYLDHNQTIKLGNASRERQWQNYESENLLTSVFGIVCNFNTDKCTVY